MNRISSAQCLGWHFVLAICALDYGISGGLFGDLDDAHHQAPAIILLAIVATEMSVDLSRGLKPVDNLRVMDFEFKET